MSTDHHDVGIAMVILSIDGASYGALYAFAGCCAVLAAVADLPVRRAR